MRRLLLAAALAVTGAQAHAGQISIYARNVDDRVDIYYNGAHQGSCTWDKNPGCSVGFQGQAQGTVQVRFVLTNYVYQGFCLTGDCGKFAGDFYIEHDGVIIWSNAIGQKNNTEGVKYDQTLSCDLSANRCR